MNCSAVATRRGAIHFFRCFVGVLDLDIEEQRLGDGGLDRRRGGRNRPRSPARSGPRSPRSTARSRRSRSIRTSQLGKGSARDGVELGMEGVVEGGKRAALARALSGTGPWQFPVGRAQTRCFAGAAKARPLRNFWQECCDLRPILAHFRCHKIEKSGPQPFPKRTGVGTYRPHPPALAAGCLLRKPFGTEDRRGCRVGSTPFRHGFLSKARNGLSRGGAAR